jgi:hypothetical protein
MNAETMRLLLAKGLSSGDLLEIAEAMERKSDSTNAERQARYRAARKGKRVTRYSNGVTPPIDNNHTPLVPCSDEQETNDLEANASSPSADGGDLKPEHFAEAWNDLAGKLGKPAIREITPERRMRLRARIAGYSLDDFREVLGNVERSPFLRGDKGWKGCTFDWLTKKANFQKVLEGNYNG